MTAEVAVLNKFGIALAADSAVTVEYFHNNKTQTKVYNSANKLFSLSKFAPIGIMFYNTATLGGIPWETIVKIYRHKLHRTKFDTVAEYCDNFFNWLDDPGNGVFDDKQLEMILRMSLFRAFFDVEHECKSKAQFVKKLDEGIAKLTKVQFVPGFDDAFVKVICKQYRVEIDEVSKFAIKPSHRAGQKKKIVEYAGLLLSRQQPLPSYSGIVIAGFGEKESLPRLRHFQTDVVVSRHTRKWLLKSYEINEANTSEVLPLADAEAIRTLIEGISPSFEQAASVGALQLILSMPKNILDPVVELTPAQKDKYIKQARQALPQHYRDFAKNMAEHRKKNYTDPIKQALSSLPISELGLVAETLLGTSQIQKRVTPQIETVGGPVDVAVISKGDGFVWIKRKHYFNQEFNPSFASRYLEQ